MASCDNASLIPTSEDYYSALEPEKLYMIYVDVALTVLILLLFGEECHFVVKTYRHFNITVKTIWLISIYPVFAISALLSVLVPRAAYICDFVSTCYLSACFFQFSSLLLQYFGHVDHLLSEVKDTGFSLRTRPCCCCCLCCPVLPATVKSLMTVRLMIFQTAVLQPIIQFTAAVLWADDKYRSGIDFTQSYVYLTLLKLASTITAIYGLNALHASTQSHLRTHNTRPKQMALQLVQIFFNIQGAVMTIPAQFNVPPCTDGFSSHFQMLEWHHLVLVVEMFLLSLLARIYYRRPLTMDAILEAQRGNLADIYIRGIPCNQAHAASSHSKAFSELRTLPHHKTADKASVSFASQQQSINQSQQQSMPDQIHSEPGAKSSQDQSAEFDKCYLISGNHLGDATGTVNPNFDGETPSHKVAEHCKTTTTLGKKEQCNTIQTSDYVIPEGDHPQISNSTEPSDSNPSADNVFPGLADSEGQPVCHKITDRQYEEDGLATKESTEIIVIRL